MRKAQQWLHFLWQLKRFGLRREILIQVYHAITENVLIFLRVWYGSCTQQQKLRLQRVVCTAGRIVGCVLPSLASIYRERTVNRSWRIVSDASRTTNVPFQLLTSGM